MPDQQTWQKIINGESKMVNAPIIVAKHHFRIFKQKTLPC